MRVCVLGNSHAALLRYDGVKALLPKSVTVTFFAATTPVFGTLKLSGKRLVAGSPELQQSFRQSSLGADFVEIEDYDFFIIVGHGVSIGAVMQNYRHFVCDRMTGPADGKYRLSDACFAAMVENDIMKSLAMRVVQMIRTVSDRPVCMVSAPNPGLGLPPAEIRAWSSGYSDIVEHGDDEAAAGIFREACASVAARQRVKIIPPLPEAAANGVFNRREYCILPEDLDAYPNKHNRLNAMLHGSDSYGAQLVRHIFADIAAMENLPQTV
jgi:hypothetical protein